jgi:hypothetical protein
MPSANCKRRANSAASGGPGLCDESVTRNLRLGQKAKAKDARLDRFGMFSISPGGQIAKTYLDDLTYTAGVVRVAGTRNGF